MPHKILSIALCIGFLVGCGKTKHYNRKNYEHYPSFDEIVEYFYSSFPAERSIKFEKKKEGWYWVELDTKKEGQIKSRALLWSAETGSYTDSVAWNKFAKLRPEEINTAIASQKQVVGREMFDKCPLFGYEDENKDLIELLDGAKGLNADELECLARAYSREASAILMPMQTEKEFHAYDTTYDKSAYSQAELSKFMDYAHKSIALYKELKDKHPDHKTIVGNIQTKWSNEYMTHWYELGIIQQDQLQSEFLVDGLYSEAVLAAAKNMLQSVPQNGILFTWGDNDTFPLLYAQAKLGMRPDVLIINTSLANLGRYIHYLTQIIGKEKQVKTALLAAKYKLNVNNYLLIQQNIRPTFWAAYLRDLGKHPERYISEGYTNIEKIVSFSPTNVFKLIEDTATIHITLRQPYLLKSEIFTLDVIACNFMERPICFSIGFPESKLNSLFSDYIYKRGFVFHLQNNGAPFGKNVEIEETERLLKQTFEYPKSINYNHKEEQMGTTYLIYTCYRLAEAYEKDSLKDKIAQTFDFLEQKYPLNKHPYGQFYLAIGAYWRNLGDMPRAEKYWEQYEAFLQKEAKENEENKETSAFERYLVKTDLIASAQRYVENLRMWQASQERISAAERVLGKL